MHPVFLSPNSVRARFVCVFPCQRDPRWPNVLHGAANNRTSALRARGGAATGGTDIGASPKIPASRTTSRRRVLSWDSLALGRVNSHQQALLLTSLRQGGFQRSATQMQARKI